MTDLAGQVILWNRILQGHHLQLMSMEAGSLIMYP